MLSMSRCPSITSSESNFGKREYFGAYSSTLNLQRKIRWVLSLQMSVNIGESYCLSTNRAIGRDAIPLFYIYKSTTRLWVDQVQSLGITPMADTLLWESHT